MFKGFKRVLTGALLLAALASCGKSPAGGAASARGAAPARDAAPAGLKAAASIYPIYDFAKKIAGDNADVTLLVPAGTEAHDWEPKNSHMIALEKSDLFFYNGAGMEHWVDTVREAISSKRLSWVNTSEGISLLEGGHSHDGDDEDEDGGHDEAYDPHVWLAPLNAKQQLHNIYRALAKADPDNEAYYRANYEKYAAEADKLHNEFTAAASGGGNRNIVTSHQAFAYLCHAYGLTQIPIQGVFAEAEPSPARMKEIMDLIREKKVKVVFAGELASGKVVDAIAAQTGASVEVLSPLESLTARQMKNGDDYFSVMRKNLAALKKALAG